MKRKLFKKFYGIVGHSMEMSSNANGGIQQHHLLARGLVVDAYNFHNEKFIIVVEVYNCTMLGLCQG